MKNLFDDNSRQEIADRVNKLSPSSTPAWGIMTVAQMLKHLSLPMELALTNPKPPRSFLGRIFGPIAKPNVIGPKPFKKNSFTPKEWKVVTQEDFESQKSNILGLLNQFKPGRVTDKVHPFFGRLTDEEWGRSQFKHFDYHLGQFGV